MLEVLLGGLVLRTDAGCWVAVTGAAGARSTPSGCPPARELRVGRPATGLRSLRRGRRRHRGRAGARLALDRHPRLGRPAAGRGGRPRCRWGSPSGEPPALDTPRPPRPGPLRVVPGPRADWFADDALGRAVRIAVRRRGRTRTGSGCASTGRRWSGGRRRRAAPARGWCSARCRCRPAAGRWCSWPTTRRPAATR